jgi:hypothetical protein
MLVGGLKVQGGSKMTGTKCDLFTHKQSRSYLNHLVFMSGPVFCNIINLNYFIRVLQKVSYCGRGPQIF